jgi:hypothetical protein
MSKFQQPDDETTDTGRSMANASNDPELQRVRDEVITRLATRGVRAVAGDSSEDLVELLEAVEAFEETVERRGGDLMVDEPVAPGKTPQPDDILFVLPTRQGNETAKAYIARIVEATADADRRAQ